MKNKNNLLSEKRMVIGITVAVICGILLHDTRIDNLASAAVVGFTGSAISYGMAAYKSVDSGEHHIHIKTIRVSNFESSIRNAMPKLPNRNDDERKYITQKRFAFGGANGEYCWPSI